MLRLDPAAINRHGDGVHLAFDLGGIMMALRIARAKRGRQRSIGIPRAARLQARPFPALDCVRSGCGRRLRCCKG